MRTRTDWLIAIAIAWPVACFIGVGVVLVLAN
jgi:hypothetical protein